ncbi:hypothetical protein NDU88_006869 [Pleurodeles waltl]|uniref:Uncharacterized protein n=1 Tax=Pleurodeles waltl TaxID=8319 RepID=A0AAV7TZ09_PLEWA|nr:hypothetical protein NDU88_006869 [Pleurodeles waltl]
MKAIAHFSKVNSVHQRSRGCDLEAAEPGWPSRPPDREEELQRQIQATETRHVCGPRLGWTEGTKREQRWAEVKRARRQWVTPGEAEAPCCLLRLRRGTHLVAPGGVTTQLPRPA